MKQRSSLALPYMSSMTDFAKPGFREPDNANNYSRCEENCDMYYSDHCLLSPPGHLANFLNFTNPTELV